MVLKCEGTKSYRLVSVVAFQKRGCGKSKTKVKVRNAALGFGFFHAKKELLQNCV